MIRFTRELAHGMSLLLESSEADIERARAQLREAGCGSDVMQRTDELLARAKARAEAVRLAIEDSNCECRE